jgi:hypothetical protein
VSRLIGRKLLMACHHNRRTDAIIPQKTASRSTLSPTGC